MNQDGKRTTKILVAGGGFAGLYAAKYFDKHLARRPDVEVTLISRENFILFTPMLHEVAAGDLSPSEIVNSLPRILRQVNVVEAEVEAIDLNARKIHCLAGLRDVEIEFEYDHLLRHCRGSSLCTLPKLLGGGAQPSFGRGDADRDWFRLGRETQELHTVSETVAAEPARRHVHLTPATN
jgi:NADPH-dependent 2,4-dienoyl-CoA reductase/sulfur reductase-like enzyme